MRLESNNDKMTKKNFIISIDRQKIGCYNNITKQKWKEGTKQ